MGTKIESSKPANIGAGFEIHKKICGPLVNMGFNTLCKEFNVIQPSSLLLKTLQYFVPYQCDLHTYLQRWEEWDLYRQDILKFFDHYDAFICPVTASDALPLETPMWDGKVNMVSFCWEISSALLPAVVVRAGTSKNGLPIGVQVVAKPYHESIALLVAQSIENILKGWNKPKL